MYSFNIRYDVHSDSTMMAKSTAIIIKHQISIRRFLDIVRTDRCRGSERTTNFVERAGSFSS